MTRPTEVIVKVKDLEKLQGLQQWVQRDKIGLHSDYDQLLDRLITLIPEPEWEPTEEQIETWRKVFPPSRSNAIYNLKRLHAVGLIMP